MTRERVEALRELMKEENVDAYLVPSTDPHASEYVPACWERRLWISGFTGSAGEVLITADQGGLWTDGRYFIQAEEQLKGSGIDLFKMGMPDVPTIEDWIVKNLKEGQTVGVDPKVLSMERAGKLEKALKDRNMSIKYMERNLVDVLWEDRPSPSSDPVIVLSDETTGESLEKKLQRLREKMTDKAADAHVLSSLDTIAWLFNLRGSDVEYNPVFISYAVVEKDSAHLFIDTEKITDEAKNHLDDLVKVHPYEEIGEYLESMGGKEIRIWLDQKTTNKWIHLLLSGKARIHRDRSPVTDFKSVKNDVELQGIRNAHIRDGAAMVKFLKWLEDSVPQGGVTELSASDRLEDFRKQGDGFVGLSFETISGYGEHGAIVHYAATEETDVPIKPEGIYLVDSGGQYVDGTTDITRTVCMGNPTEEQKDMFTRVLKGHIDLSLLRFPKGFSGKQIELPARKALWDAGKNYNHGTGHGIGHYLNVHEGPMGITPRDIGVPLDAGNVLSNEPGYYKAGEYGIRTENVVVVVKDENLSSEELTFLGFETLTMCPIDLSLVKPELLTKEEISWLNDYHGMVFEKVSPLLDEDHSEWLKEKTGPIK
ncbi:MAG: aminopeptidase P family protein [Thermoplasmatota archaeon]